MFAYWLLFAVFAIGSLNRSTRSTWGLERLGLVFGLALCFMIIIVGLRYDVGGDWETYEFIFSHARYSNLGRALAKGDPGYQVLNWLCQRAGIGIWAVNLACSFIFVWGLGRLARSQPLPWLSVLVSIPYLVIVVAMGYSRQAVAIGIIMAGLAALASGASLVRFALYVAAAALFHKTAVVVLPLLIFTGERNRFLNLVAGVALSVLLYDVFLADDVDLLVKNYVGAEYNSQGAAVRVAMNLIPAFIMLKFGPRLSLPEKDVRVWRAFAWTSILLLVVLIISPSSTAVDRIALYMIPLQIIAMPRIVVLFRSPDFGRAIIVIYAAAIQFTWLSFATHAQYWVPYHFYPLGGLDLAPR